MDRLSSNRALRLFAARRNAEAIALLRPLVQLGTQGYSFQTTKRNIDGAASFTTVSFLPLSSLPTTRARPMTCTLPSMTTTRP